MCSQTDPSKLQPLCDYLSQEVAIEWTLRTGKKLTDWFALTKPKTLNQMSPDELFSLIKARNERLVTIRANINPDALWQNNHLALNALGFDTQAALEPAFVSLLEQIMRQAIATHKQQLETVFLEQCKSLLCLPMAIQAPDGGRLMVIEPGGKAGLKLAVTDNQGNVLSNSIIFPHEPQNQTQQSIRKLEGAIQTNRVSALVIATLPHYREARQFIKSWLLESGRSLPVYRLIPKHLELLYPPMEGQDNLYNQVNGLCRLATQPRQELSRLPLKCLIEAPLFSVVNQSALTNRLEMIWAQHTQDEQPALPDPLFENPISTLTELRPGQSLQGRLVNQTDYGYFIDVGILENGLLHHSQLKSKHTLNNEEIISVRVLDCNLNKQQFSLTTKSSKPSKKRSPKPKPASNSAMADALSAAFGKKD